MSHFAKVENGIVTEVLVIEQDVLDTGLFGDPSLFVKCSYNTMAGKYYTPGSDHKVVDPDQTKALRKNFPAIGYIYDADKDAFYLPQPYPSWSLNENTCCWEPPTPAPQPNPENYTWDESSQSWVKFYYGV